MYGLKSVYRFIQRTTFLFHLLFLVYFYELCRILYTLFLDIYIIITYQFKV